MAKKKKSSGGSLQDQLKSAGLVSEKQINKARKVIHRQEVRVKQGVDVDESKLAVKQAQANKTNQDKLRNEQIRNQAETKALEAQIKQLTSSNSQRQRGDVEYNFTEGGKVKKIYISHLNKDQLNKGYLAIVKSGDSYDLVPEKVARRIMERDTSFVLYLYDRDQNVVDEDDPYKDFQIPDDLEW